MVLKGFLVSLRNPKTRKCFQRLVHRYIDLNWMLWEFNLKTHGFVKEGFLTPQGSMFFFNYGKIIIIKIETVRYFRISCQSLIFEKWLIVGNLFKNRCVHFHQPFFILRHQRLVSNKVSGDTNRISNKKNPSNLFQDVKMFV